MKLCFEKMPRTICWFQLGVAHILGGIVQLCTFGRYDLNLVSVVYAKRAKGK